MTENLKEALSYTVELAGKENKIIRSGTGKEYFDGNEYSLQELNPRKYAPILELQTLKSLVDYLKSDNDLIGSHKINKLANLALFEADGGKWKLEAVENIANYLKNELASNEKITILA